MKESARSFGQADALPGLKCLEYASPSALAWCLFSASWIPFEIIDDLPKIRSNNFRLSEASEQTVCISSNSGSEAVRFDAPKLTELKPQS